MINKEFFKQAVDLANYKNVKVEEIYETFAKSLQNAFKKFYGHTSCRVEMKPEKSEILMFSVHKVVEDFNDNYDDDDEIEEMLLEDAIKIKSTYKVGDIIEQPVNIKNFTRTAIGAAKSTWTQNLKTLERVKAYEYFKEKENEMIKARVVDINPTGRFVTLDLSHNVYAFLPKTDLLPNDVLHDEDFVNVYIKKVEQTSKDPKVTVSRSERNLVIRLMESYIPEIAAGVIEIKGIARDPGDRTKIAIYSNDPKVDPIGSCVGEGGARIREVCKALNGEKIDLYEWSEDPAKLIEKSLQPAHVTTILNIDPIHKTSLAVVPDNELSLAIGKAGQNVRLAVQSCGWKIDIKPTSKAYDEGLLI